MQMLNSKGPRLYAAALCGELLDRSHPDPLAEHLDRDLRGVPGPVLVVVLLVELLEKVAQVRDPIEKRLLRLVRSLGVPVKSPGQVGDPDERLVLFGILQHLDEHAGLFDLHIHRLAQSQPVFLGLFLGLLEDPLPELPDTCNHSRLEPAQWRHGLPPILRITTG